MDSSQEKKRYVFPVYDIDGKTRKVKVKRNFQVQCGCGGKCPIEIRESRVHHRNGEQIKGEICCQSARQCCFACFEEGCPVKEVYKDIIQHFGILEEDDEMDMEE